MGEELFLDLVTVAQSQEKQGQAADADQHHAPEGDGDDRASHAAGHQKAPGAGKEDDDEKADAADIGKSGQNTDKVVGKEGEEKDQNEKNIPFASDNIQIAVRDLLTDELTGKPLSQSSGQPKDNHGTQEHGGDREEKGLPHAEEQGAGCGGEVAGDGCKDNRGQLHQKIDQLRVWRKAVDVALHPVEGTYVEEAGSPEKEDPAANHQQGRQKREKPSMRFHCIPHVYYSRWKARSQAGAGSALAVPRVSYSWDRCYIECLKNL